MNIRHEEFEISETEPFSTCRLDRKQYADILTNILEKYSKGFVFAINNEWGTGKTTFVKMWQKHLTLNGFRTLYFNAWENDFEPSPLVAIISELKELINSREKAFKTLVEKGSIVAKSVLPDLLKAIASNYIDTAAITDALKNTADAGAEIFKNEVEEYAKKKKGLKEFKISLIKYIEEEKIEDGLGKEDRKDTEKKPVVFIIDELDRCRPNYAVELLEQIKHLFSVSGIVFILAIDKIQLGNAVRGVYGSDRIDAEEYLKRFIDIEYSIPSPETKVFCSYLYDYYEFEKFFFSEKRKKVKEFYEDREIFIEISSWFFKKAKLTLRQQDKIFSHARVGLLSFAHNQYVFPNLYLVLIFIKNFHLNFYNNIKLKLFSAQEFINEFYKVVPKGIEEPAVRGFIHIEALSVIMYNNSLVTNHGERLIKRDECSQKDVSGVTSKFDTSSDQRIFIQFLRYIYESNYGETLIDFLLKRIELSINPIQA